jgi:hypothetical protein
MISNLGDSHFPINLTKLVHRIVQVCMICFGLISLYYNFFGLRVHLYELASLIVIFVLFLYFIKVQALWRSSLSSVTPVVLLLLISLIVDMLSFIGVIFGGNHVVLIQFSKGIAQSSFLTVFLIFFLVFNALTDFKYSVKYLNILCFMVLLSCFYQYLYLVCLLVFEVNVDDIVWPILSLGSYEPVDDYTLGKDIFKFARHGGFSKNPNFLVTQLICVLPYVILMSLKSSKRHVFMVIIFVTSMLVTISLSALLGLLMIICTLPFVSKSIFKSYAYFLITWCPLIVVFFVTVDVYLDLGFLLGIYDLFAARSVGGNYFESSRWSLALAGFDMFDKYPIFGAGLNASPVLLEDYSITALTGPSLHNYWVQLAVERGVLSIFKVLFYLFILFKCYHFKNIYSRGLVISLLSLFVNGLTNSGFGHPYVQLFIVCMYCCCMHKKSLSA